MNITVLDPGTGLLWVNDAGLDPGQDRFRALVKSVLDILARHSARLQEQNFVFLRKPRSFQERDLPIGLQIDLVPAQNDDDVRTGERFRVGQPLRQGVEGFTTGGVVDQQGAGGASVIAALYQEPSVSSNYFLGG